MDFVAICVLCQDGKGRGGKERCVTVIGKPVTGGQILLGRPPLHVYVSSRGCL
jgi:hypothetical protein